MLLDSMKGRRVPFPRQPQREPELKGAPPQVHHQLPDGEGLLPQRSGCG